MMYSAYKLNKHGNNMQPWHTPPDLEPVSCSMSSSNCCFLTCIQISQEAGKVIWYSYLLKSYPQFVVTHTVKGFSIVNETKVDVFWNSLAFSMIQWMLTIWSLVLLPFLNSACISGSSQFMYCWSLAGRILSITLLACEMSTTVRQFEQSLALTYLGLEWKLIFSSPVATAESSKFADTLSAAL